MSAIFTEKEVEDALEALANGDDTKYKALKKKKEATNKAIAVKARKARRKASTRRRLELGTKVEKLCKKTKVDISEEDDLGELLELGLQARDLKEKREKSKEYYDGLKTNGGYQFSYQLFQSKEYTDFVAEQRLKKQDQ